MNKKVRILIEEKEQNELYVSLRGEDPAVIAALIQVLKSRVLTVPLTHKGKMELVDCIIETLRDAVDGDEDGLIS